MTRRQLLSETDSQELSHWFALYLLEHRERMEAAATGHAVNAANQAATEARKSLRSH